MKHLTRFSLAISSALVLFFGSLPIPTAVGATIPKVIAVFETSLASKITASATSMTLVSGTDAAGNAISGYIGFVIDEGTASEEFVACTASSTALTSCLRGIDPVDGDLEVTALKQEHRRGASVKITNHPVLAIIARILNNDEQLPGVLRYASGVSTSTIYANGQNLVSVNTLTDVVAAGAANASETSRGISELATAAECANGTSAGDTGARLVCPTSAFSSSTTSTTVIPVTNSSGKLAQGFLDLTQGFTFSGGVTSTATTTITGGIVVSSTSAIPVVRTYPATGTTTASSTWSKPANLRYIIVELVGGGGGGGGDDSSNDGQAAGGGGGGYCRELIAASSLGATETVTYGGGGAAGTSGSTGTDGATGGTSSFGSHCSATGGSGGQTNDSTPSSPPLGGAGGVGSNGDINIKGGGGSSGWDDTGSDATNVGGGIGGSSVLGGGGIETGAGGNYGGGGGATGNGAPGIVVVTEYYI